MSENLVGLLPDMYSNTYGYLTVQEELPSLVKTTSRLQQESSIFPFPFNVVIEELTENVSKGHSDAMTKGSDKMFR